MTHRYKGHKGKRLQDYKAKKTKGQDKKNYLFCLCHRPIICP